MNISVVGLGKLGAPLAAVLANSGHRVIGVDVDATKVAALAAGKAPVEETGLAHLITQAAPRLFATTDLPVAVRDTDATFVIVPTPSDPNGVFSNALVVRAFESIAHGIRQKNAYHLVSLVSTVMPGTMSEILQPLLERVSGKRAGPDFGLCYNPAFIALGSVIADLLKPDLVLIGQSDAKAGDMLVAMYKGVHLNDPAFARMNYVNAELSKISINTFVTTRISYANMLAGMCEKLDGADVDVVTGAIGLDGRIGRKYLKGGSSFGGPCFPRDNLAFAALAQRLGTRSDLAEATNRLNDWQIERVAKLAMSHLPAGGTVGILGLAYKSGTDVTEMSMGLRLAESLTASGARVVVHDELAGRQAARILPRGVNVAQTMAQCAGQADVLVLPLMTDEFRALTPEQLKPGRPVVIDCWRMLKPAQFKTRASYIAIGIAPADGAG